MAGSPRAETHLDVYVLGSLHLELNNQPIHLPTRKIERLFTYLLLHPDFHRREKLAALFWGDSPQEGARASLRQALSALRGNIDKQLILSDRASIQIDPSFSVFVDVINFQRIAQQFLAQPVFGSEPFNRELYPGELLPEHYDDWILPIREHYHTLFIDVMLRSVELLRARSEYKHAIEYTQQILEADPANERAHQHLMFCFVTKGERNKALQQYAACESALRDELDVEPSRETQALYHWIKETVTSIPSRAAKITNLPIPISSFVGRIQELTEIKQLVSTLRLVTLTGVGGSGKTRLAIHAATDLIDAFRDGVWWVELAPLSESSLVPYAIARGLGLENDPKKPVIESIIHFLHNRQVLLVLDNCEHLIEACSELAETLLNECKGLKILTTSREALGMIGEQIWSAPTLSIPDTAEISPIDLLMQYEAVQLFVERSHAVRSDYVFSGKDAQAVVQICRRLDGIPLAIELAAAKMKIMSAEQIATRLEDQFSLLSSGPRIAEERHRTLQATVDWSYHLLTVDERLLFNRLSIFAGGWTINSAEVICSGKGIDKGKVLELLTHLADKSLINVEKTRERYSMLETLKAYGRGKLAEIGEIDWIQIRYLDYFLELAETADKKIRGHEQLIWLERLNLERDNLSHAIGESLNDATAREKSILLVCALGHYWSLIGDINTSRYWLLKAYDASEDLGRTVTRAKILFAISFHSALSVFALPLSKLKSLLEESIDIWSELGPEYRLEKAKCLLTQGYIYKTFLNDDKGFVLFNESIEIFRAENDLWWQAWALDNMFVTMNRNGPLELICNVLEEAKPLITQLGDRWGIGGNLMNWGFVALKQGDYVEAEKKFLKSLAVFEELGAKGLYFIIFRNMGSVKRGMKQYEKADWYYKQAIPQIEATGLDYKFTIVYLGLGFIALRRNDPQQAEIFLDQAFKFSLDTKVTERILFCIAGFAALELLRGNPICAARFFGAYSLHFEKYTDNPERGVFRCPVTLLDIEHFTNLCQEQMNTEAYQQAWHSGRSLSLEETIREIHELKQQSQ